jgi:hypothetical protein
MGVSRKTRPLLLEDEHFAPGDRREGAWTKLELVEMDARFSFAQ